MELSLPALAHRVTVFGSTRNAAATSAGVSSGFMDMVWVLFTVATLLGELAADLASAPIGPRQQRSGTNMPASIRTKDVCPPSVRSGMFRELR